MAVSRRTLLSGIGLALPFGLGGRAKASSRSAPVLQLRSFEDTLRAALDKSKPDSTFVRVEIGHSELVSQGLQGFHNDQAFAGFPAGKLKIIRTGFEPGPVRLGVRLYISTVDIALTGGAVDDWPSQPLDFRTLPPAPQFA